MPVGDTIAAIATPPGIGGLSVLRLSGPEAFAIAARVFRPASGRAVADMPGYTAAFGEIIDGGAVIDEGILTAFRAPKSYTGEPVCEISCHGGDYLARRVLAALIGAGARPATAGEFTKRAFLHGKMDLTRAESVIELIEAEGEAALRLATLAREGHTEQKVDAIADRLVNMAAALAAYADYPDEDLGETDPADLAVRIEGEIAALDALTGHYEAGQILRRGVHTAIVGRPNVGKSSLFNALFGRPRAIVTDIPGTTRDVVEAEALIEGVRFVMGDTAGLRETDDRVEQIGVSLSYAHMAGADLVLCVVDAGAPMGAEEQKLIASLRGRRAILVRNKADLSPADGAMPVGFDGPVVAVSALTGEGMDALRRAMVAACDIPGSADGMLLANERQLSCALRARDALAETRDALAAGVTLDAVAALLDSAIAPLLQLTGREVSEAVIDALFAKFCVGK